MPPDKSSPAEADVQEGKLVYFVEPDIAVRLVSRQGSSVTTRWHFFDAGEPRLTIAELPCTARVVDVTSSRKQLEQGADTWLRDLTDLAAHRQSRPPQFGPA